MATLKPLLIQNRLQTIYAAAVTHDPSNSLFMLKRTLHRVVLLLVLALTGAPLLSSAQLNSSPPGLLNYQGYLTDANGIPLGNGNPTNYPVQFRIYNDPTASGVTNLIWGELQLVTVDRGYFTVLLGSGTAIAGSPWTNNLTGLFTAPDASSRYVGMTAPGLSSVEILPRLRLLASPYALLAANAVNAANLVNSSGTPLINASGNTVNITGNVNLGGNTITGNGSGLTGLTSAQIPSLDASKIVSGTFTAAQIPNLDASKIISGTFTTTQIPNLDAGKIVSGTFTAAQIPNLDGSKIASGTVVDARLSSNVALRAGGNTFSGSQAITGGGLQVAGTVRMGSETGTSEAPNRSGLVLRRINSSVTTAGSVVALGNDGATLQRDGTTTGLRLFNATAWQFNTTIVWNAINNAGAVSSGSISTSGQAAGTAFTLVTDAQRIAYIHICWGDPLNATDFTEVTLLRWDNPSYVLNSQWIGTVSSTVNQ